MTEKEKMLRGELYNSFDKELHELRMIARDLNEKFNNTPVRDAEKRTEIIKKTFGTTKEKIYIEPAFRCDYGFNIHVGENFYMNFDCVILDVCKVIIGDNCWIAPQVGIFTATHPIEADIRNRGLGYGKPVKIGDNCWIGAHSTINPGVTLGNNVVVASGSVVTKSFDNNVVIAGNPAKVIKIIK